MNFLICEVYMEHRLLLIKTDSVTKSETENSLLLAMVIVTVPCVTVVTPSSFDAMEIIKFSLPSVKSSLEIGTLMLR